MRVKADIGPRELGHKNTDTVGEKNHVWRNKTVLVKCGMCMA